MNETQIKNRAKLAVKRALQGQTTGQDLISITKFQNKDTFGICDVTAAKLVLYQITFN